MSVVQPVSVVLSDPNHSPTVSSHSQDIQTVSLASGEKSHATNRKIQTVHIMYVGCDTCINMA